MQVSIQGFVTQIDFRYMMTNNEELEAKEMRIKNKEHILSPDSLKWALIKCETVITEREAAAAQDGSKLRRWNGNNMNLNVQEHVDAPPGLSKRSSSLSNERIWWTAAIRTAAETKWSGHFMIFDVKSLFVKCAVRWAVGFYRRSVFKRALMILKAVRVRYPSTHGHRGRDGINKCADFPGKSVAIII